eukprot:15444598-Alexandrium_andersonii.AAC.1
MPEKDKRLQAPQTAISSARRRASGRRPTVPTRSRTTAKGRGLLPHWRHPRVRAAARATARKARTQATTAGLQ